MSNVVREAVRDIALLVFDRAVEYARKRVVDGKAPTWVTREDFEQAIIELRFEQMGVTLAQIDLMREVHEMKMRELQRQLDDERARGDVPDTVIVERDGTEEFTPVFRKK